jgi:cytoplasmic polyadenylation element-binding protein
LVLNSNDSTNSRSSYESGFYNNLSRSNSPLGNESQDLGSPTFENRSLSDLMVSFWCLPASSLAFPFPQNFLHLNQPTKSQQQQEAQQRQEQQAYQYSQAEIKQLQAFQAFQILQQQQQLQQQLNTSSVQQILQQQLLNRFSQVQQMQSWRQPTTTGNGSLDHAAKYHRSSAALYDASCTWSGVLPPRSHRFITYSPKVFLGGIPWDISEQTLMQILKPFGQIRIEWPGKEQNAAQPKGYVYVIFESEKQVKALLQACSIQDTFSGSSSGESTGSIPSLCSSSMVSGNHNGNYYYKISSKRIKEKEVEVIPWIIGDSNYIKNTNQKLDSTMTVFVGALHGKLTAEALAKIMNDLFDGVVYAGIDTDKYKYPIGSGRVTFNNMRSYMRAVSAAFIEIKTSKFTKKVQVDPYLEDALCSMCGVQHGPYYCRELSCFR